LSVEQAQGIKEGLSLEPTAVITKEMTIAECVERYPETVDVFVRRGLACFGCAVSQLENIEQGAALHGIDADKLVTELNEAAKNSTD
jgi:hybrid cluster-associated redox disulfide protein